MCFIFLFMCISSCSTFNSSNILSSYPKSGSYTGSAYSKATNSVGTGKGIITNGSAKFDLITVSINRQTNIITNISAKLQGRFLLNSPICFSGQEEINTATTAFIVFNCTIDNNNLSGAYKNNLGDYGELTISLNY